MPRLVFLCLCLCALLASCGTRRPPPAALTRCFNYAVPVEIDGVPQQALSTYCVEEDGSIALRR